jgi:hypothetical protein
MRRRLLITLTAAGSLIVALAGTGLFAALHDTARSGTNQVQTGELPSSADLKVASALINDSFTCGEYSDDLSSGLFTATFEQSTLGSSVGARGVCIRNDGAQTVALTMGVEDVTDTELGCTGDEAVYDLTCGAGQVGELSGVFHQNVYEVGCNTVPTPTFLWGGTLQDMKAVPVGLGSLNPNETRCFSVGTLLLAANPGDLQAAQTDQVTWKYVWSGDVS